ncbi:hypothetical protein HW273_09445 [Oribacterium sp. oral taxon 102]|nr:hypothetical protein [Oribacterium sp. oral taxon 102]
MLLFGSIMAYAQEMSASISSVTIGGQANDRINVNLQTNQKTAGTDGKLYIFEMKPYQPELTRLMKPVASADISGNMTVSFDLNAGPGEKRLYSAFMAAVKTGRGYEAVSDRHYITNPEVLAGNRDAARNPGKKGLRVDPNILDDALSLNIKHAGVDIPTHRFFGSGISYSYEGKTFSINAELINQLDQEVKRLSDSGVAVTAILLNAWNTVTPELNRNGISQLPAAQAQYYTFNVETEAGFRAVKAMASFLAKRYNGQNGHGKITNWVVGNEIDNQYWNYAGDFDVASYTRLFQRAFRVFYTAMKAESSNDNIMFSLDHYWNSLPEAAPVGKYKGRDVLEWFNHWDYAEGRTNWALAYHPYSYPLSSPEFWDDEESGKVDQTNDTQVISFQNLHVLTDFMRNEAMLTPGGEVRKIFLTEQGFSSTKGKQDKTQEQAAAVAYSYYIVDNNPYISAYLLSRQEDNEGETAHGLSFGLSSIQNHQLVAKPAHEVFRYIDDPAKSLEVSEFAKEILGITDWSERIPDFHAPAVG